MVLHTFVFKERWQPTGSGLLLVRWKARTHYNRKDKGGGCGFYSFMYPVIQPLLAAAAFAISFNLIKHF